MRNSAAQPEKPMAAMSGVASASSVVNDTTVDIDKIGYTTKEGMQLFGMSTNEQGQTTYHYTKRIGYMSWYNADKAIEELNQNTALTYTYGKASFPTDCTSQTNELGMMFKEQAALGIKDNYIHGEELGCNNSRYLGCLNGDQNFNGKANDNAAFPVWRVDRLVA